MNKIDKKPTLEDFKKFGIFLRYEAGDPGDASIRDEGPPSEIPTFAIVRMYSLYGMYCTWRDWLIEKSVWEKLHV